MGNWLKTSIQNIFLFVTPTKHADEIHLMEIRIAKLIRNICRKN